MRRARNALIVVVAALWWGGMSVAPAAAQGMTGFEPGAGFGVTPAVPMGSLTSALGGFDPARLSVSTSVSVGSGFAGGTQGLQVTSLRYRFSAPLTMSVNLGSTFGGATANPAFFLEGLSLSYRPSASTVFNFEFRDVRSPLQFSRTPLDPFMVDGWGR